MEETNVIMDNWMVYEITQQYEIRRIDSSVLGCDRDW